MRQVEFDRGRDMSFSLLGGQVRIVKERAKYSWPLFAALGILIANSAKSVGFPLPEHPDLILLFFSTGRIDAASSVMTALFVLFSLAAIHLENRDDMDKLDRLLARHLPATLWGFGISCFVASASFSLGLLFTLTGTLLLRDPKYNIK